MDDYTYHFTGTIEVYPGESGWHFIPLPQQLSQQLTKKFHGLRGGWGSLKVQATINQTTWDTSIFPDFQTKLYLLPIKLGIRKQAQLHVGSVVSVSIQILVADLL